VAAALAGSADVFANMLVATAFRVVVVHPDVSYRSRTVGCDLLVIDALDMRARILGEVCTILLGALFPFVADSRASLAAEGGLSLDVAELRTGALVDGRLHASGPCAPLGSIAINGAWHSVASLLEAGSRAGLAAEHRLADNCAGSVAGATAAGLGALRPLGNGPHLAIDRAGALAADLGTVEGRALLAEEVGFLNDVAFAVAHATTAGAGAGGPLAELRVDAILGAALRVAFLSLLEQRAGGATALVGNGAGAGHVAGTTLFGAFGVVTPASHSATDRAGAGVALAVLVEVNTAGEHTFLATEGSNVAHLAGALLDAVLARN